MTKVAVILHRSLHVEGEKFEFQNEFTNISLLGAITELLKKSKELSAACLENGRKKPGLLYFSNKVELSSLGLLETNVDDAGDTIIRIVPILHGG